MTNQKSLSIKRSSELALSVLNSSFVCKLELLCQLSETHFVANIPTDANPFCSVR